MALLKMFLLSMYYKAPSRDNIANYRLGSAGLKKQSSDQRVADSISGPTGLNLRGTSGCENAALVSVPLWCP